MPESMVAVTSTSQSRLHEGKPTYASDVGVDPVPSDTYLGGEIIRHTYHHTDFNRAIVHVREEGEDYRMRFVDLCGELHMQVVIVGEEKLTALSKSAFDSKS
jgi:hypothetical protein